MAYSTRIKICDTTTSLKNYHLISKEDRERFRSTIEECLREYNLDEKIGKVFFITDVEISKRLKTTAGKCCWTGGNEVRFKIKLAANNYKEFGSDNMDKVLRHEIAHLIEVVEYGKSGHSERFKKICAKLGGSMNGLMAGEKYSEHATRNFCRTQYRFKYMCPCGMSFQRKRKITGRTLYSRCKKCGTEVRDMKMKNL